MNSQPLSDKQKKYIGFLIQDVRKKHNISEEDWQKYLEKHNWGEPYKLDKEDGTQFIDELIRLQQLDTFYVNGEIRPEQQKTLNVEYVVKTNLTCPHCGGKINLEAKK